MVIVNPSYIILNFKLRRLDECVWWRVCHSKDRRIKSQSDFPWEGLKITGDKKEKGAHIRSLDKGQRQHTNKDIRKPVVPVYQLYQKDQDQIRDATYISDVVFLNLSEQILNKERKVFTN